MTGQDLGRLDRGKVVSFLDRNRPAVASHEDVSVSGHLYNVAIEKDSSPVCHRASRYPAVASAISLLLRATTTTPTKIRTAAMVAKFASQ